MYIKKKKGFLIVDAAFCLPIFLIAFATLLFLIAQCGIEETIQYALIQSARSTSRVLCLCEEKDYVSTVGAGAFHVNWGSFFYSEWKEPQPEAFIVKLTFGEDVALLGSMITIDNVSRAYATVESKIPILQTFADHPFSLKKIVYRPFVGESEQSTSYDATRVYVFPKRGERYHIRSCYILQGGGIEVLLTEQFRRVNKPCPICNPQELPNGSNVYIVKQESNIYHRKSCPTITKSYVCMSKSEAISKGYTPCQICQEGEI
ncbi:MAG: hypothetical protein EOM59_02800 [Clostridia bacterium]|nr:hypothetical protein [Clostridia bacterium]